ncbi:hypothetical protein WME89_42330 [Sorangium sp. So ce321]|uniref:hypothetical protein n=1 Tax=Sorangium sp. So ce321 TaxID=3133300 RepID=UPI003F5FEF08
MRLAAALGVLLGIGLSLDLARAQVPPRPAGPAEQQPPPSGQPPASAVPSGQPPAPSAPSEQAAPIEQAAPSERVAPIEQATPPPAPPGGLPAIAPQVELPTREMSASFDSSSVRALSTNSLLLPAGGLEIGGEMTLVTSELSLGRDPDGEGLAFTDVGLLSLNGRYSFGPVELAAAMALLVKQPDTADELVPQNGSLAGRVALGDGQALTLRLAGGPLLADLGLWEGGELLLQAKRAAHSTLVFQGALGGAFTHLDFAKDTEQPFWLGEVVVDAETILRTPVRAFTLWLGVDLRFPVLHNPGNHDPDPSGFLAPTTRLNVYVGTAYSYVDDWDLYLRVAVLDRGDKAEPWTMVPILDGGFDQQQFSLGVMHRWDLAEKKEERRAWMSRR